MPKSKAKAISDARFNKKTYEQFFLKLRFDSEINCNVVRAHAKSTGESAGGFIKRAIAEAVEQDKIKIGRNDNGTEQ